VLEVWARARRGPDEACLGADDEGETVVIDDGSDDEQRLRTDRRLHRHAVHDEPLVRPSLRPVLSSSSNLAMVSSAGQGCAKGAEDARAAVAEVDGV